MLTKSGLDFIIANKRLAGPMGLFVPVSHASTVLTDTPRTAAKVFWVSPEDRLISFIMSVDDIECKREFEDFSSYYYSIRELYEKILLLDDILAGADDSTDYVSLSSEYEQLLDTVSYIVIQLEAYSPASAYRQTYEMMTELIKTDIAVYLQNISAALAKNDSDKWQKAVIDRENVLVKFSKVTGNLLSIGETVKGVSTADISGWNARDIITAERDQNVQQQ